MTSRSTLARVGCGCRRISNGMTTSRACSMRRVLFGCMIWCTSLHVLALTAVAPSDVSLAGRWSVNVAQSDDGEALLAERMKEIAKEQRRLEERHRPRMEKDPFAGEPEFTPPHDTPQDR